MGVLEKSPCLFVHAGTDTAVMIPATRQCLWQGLCKRGLVDLNMSKGEILTDSQSLLQFRMKADPVVGSCQ